MCISTLKHSNHQKIYAFFGFWWKKTFYKEKLIYFFSLNKKNRNNGKKAACIRVWDDSKLKSIGNFPKQKKTCAILLIGITRWIKLIKTVNGRESTVLKSILFKIQSVTLIWENGGKTLLNGWNQKKTTNNPNNQAFFCTEENCVSNNELIIRLSFSSLIYKSEKCTVRKHSSAFLKESVKRKMDFKNGRKVWMWTRQSKIRFWFVLCAQKSKFEKNVSYYKIK